MNYHLIQEIEQFYYAEARLLDERKFDPWLALFTDDVRYWMPVMATRERGEKEVADEKGLAFFDDNKHMLSLRVQRLSTGLAFAEEPPSRTRRLITNVQIQETDLTGEIFAYCNFMIYRTRLEKELDLFVGRREDKLRKADGGWMIAGRKMILDQNVLNAKNLSIFF